MAGLIQRREQEPVENSIQESSFWDNPQQSILEALRYVCVDPTSGFNNADNIKFTDANGTSLSIAQGFNNAKANPLPGMEFLQPNSLAGIDLAPGSEICVIGHTQSGKTLAAWYKMYCMAVTHGLVPVMFAMNRRSEPERFAKDAEKFNKLVETVIKILGLEGCEEQVFWFTSVHGDGSGETAIWSKENGNKKKLTSVYIDGQEQKITKNDKEEHASKFETYGQALKGWSNNRSIAVMVTIANDTRFKRMETIIEEICEKNGYVETETGTHAKFFSVCDESDKLITQEDLTSTRARFFGRQFSVKNEHGNLMQFQSLYQAPMALMDLTATPQIQAIVQRQSWRVTRDPVEMEPSKNFYGYIKYLYQVYNIINRVFSENWVDMIGNMILTPFIESALVYIVSNTEQRKRCRQAAKEFQSIFAVAWDGDHVYAATMKDEYITVLGNVSLVNRTLEVMFGLPSNSLKENKQFEKIVTNGITTFETVSRSYVTSYPILMELFSRLVDMGNVHKTVLFAGFMACRGTPIKSFLNHKFGLTFMYIGSCANAESLVQLAGRLCGIVSSTELFRTFMEEMEDGTMVSRTVRHTKSLWASKKIHRFHRMSLEKTPILMYLIQCKVNVHDALADMEKIVSGVRTGSPYIPSVETRAVINALMVDGPDSRLGAMGTVHKKRKAFDKDIGTEAKRKSVAKPVFSFDAPRARSFEAEKEHTEGARYGSIVEDNDECAIFVSEKLGCFKTISSYIKSRSTGGVNDFVDVDGVVSQDFINFLVEASESSDKNSTTICKMGSPPSRSNACNYVEIKANRATQYQNKSTMVKISGCHNAVSKGVGKYLKTVYISRSEVTVAPPAPVARQAAPRKSPSKGVIGMKLCEFIRDTMGQGGNVPIARAEMVARFIGENSVGASIWGDWVGKLETNKVGMEALLRSHMTGIVENGRLEDYSIGQRRIQNSNLYEFFFEP